MNLLTQNALMLSDSYVVVCLPEYLSVRGITLIQEQISQMMEAVNNNLTRFGASSVLGPVMRGIIFNRVRYVSGGTISQENYMQQVRRVYPGLAFENFVAESVRVAEASATTPITFSNRVRDQAYVGQLEKVPRNFSTKLFSCGDSGWRFKA